MSTPRQGLRELLFPVGTIPETLDALLIDASNEIRQLREKLNRQSTKLAEALELKNNWMAEANAGAVLRSSALLAKEKENQHLREELARLRPPEPLFRVGQVVAAEGTRLYRVVNRRDWNGGTWNYDVEAPGYSALLTERSLRSLTDDEK
jgi:hypothetical protein